MTAARAAVVVAGQPDYTIVDVALEAPGAHEVLVRVVAVGMCHTDETVRSGWPAERQPMVFGHEGAGVVEQVGSAVTHVARGDHVVMSFSSCGSCDSCSDGLVGYCQEFVARNASGVRPSGTSGITAADGSAVFGAFFGQSSFASHCLVPARNVVGVPDDIDLAELAPFGCSVMTGVGVVRNVLRSRPTDSLVVFGAGAVGMCAVMAAAAAGVGVIVVVDPVGSRRDLGLELGAHHVVDPGAGDVAVALREVIPRGFSQAIDTTANAAVVNTALAVLRPTGLAVAVGVGLADLTIDCTQLVRNGRGLRGSIEGDADPHEFIPELIDMYRRGELPMHAIVRRLDFAAINDAVAASKSGAVIKPVLVFGGSR